MRLGTLAWHTPLATCARSQQMFERRGSRRRNASKVGAAAQWPHMSARISRLSKNALINQTFFCSDPRDYLTASDIYITRNLVEHDERPCHH
jgi:hypothetical protein